jgi:hypothetical protein
VLLWSYPWVCDEQSECLNASVLNIRIPARSDWYPLMIPTASCTERVIIGWMREGCDQGEEEMRDGTTGAPSSSWTATGCLHA